MNIKVALYLYTFILIIAGIFTAFSIVTNSDRLAFAQSADSCPGNSNFQTIDQCTQSCIQGGMQNNNPQWVEGCYNACVNICVGNGGTGGTPASCGDGQYNPPGETPENCPSDYNASQNNNNNSGGTSGSTNQGYIGTIGTQSGKYQNGKCESGLWQLYECSAQQNACGTYAQGCNPTTSAIKIVGESEAMAFIAGTPSCSVRQADCIKTSGVNLVFRSRINCSGDCFPTNTVTPPTPTNPPVQPSLAACEHPCGPSDNGRACQNGLTCTNLGGGYKCRLTDHPEWVACQPPQTQTVSCNDECNTSDRLCGNGLTCTNIAGINRCRLPANLSSATCQPEQPQTVACNDECNTTNRLCGNGLTCTNVAGTNRCRLPANPSSATCQPAVVQPKCNDLCNNTDLLCPSGLSCTNIDGTNRCRLPSNTSSATCQPQEVIPPNYKIEKVLEGNQGPFNIGELVTFRVRITNIGQTTLTNVRFRDVYNSNYITYVGGSAIKSSGGSISDINPHLTLKINGEIQIANVASSSVLGSIAPGNYYEFTLKFIAKAPTSSTCNVGYADLPDLPEISDDACLPIKNIDTDL